MVVFTAVKYKILETTTKIPNNCCLAPFATRQSFFLKKDFTFSSEKLNKMHWEHNKQSSSLLQVVCIYGELGIHWAWFSCKKISLLCYVTMSMLWHKGWRFSGFLCVATCHTCLDEYMCLVLNDLPGLICCIDCFYLLCWFSLIIWLLGVGQGYPSKLFASFLVFCYLTSLKTMFISMCQLMAHLSENQASRNCLAFLDLALFKIGFQLDLWLKLTMCYLLSIQVVPSQNLQLFCI